MQTTRPLQANNSSNPYNQPAQPTVSIRPTQAVNSSNPRSQLGLSKQTTRPTHAVNSPNPRCQFVQPKQSTRPTHAVNLPSRCRIERRIDDWEKGRQAKFDRRSSLKNEIGYRTCVHPWTRTARITKTELQKTNETCLFPSDAGDTERRAILR